MPAAVAIRISNVEQSRKLYTEQLGLPEVTRPDFDLPGICTTSAPGSCT